MLPINAMEYKIHAQHKLTKSVFEYFSAGAGDEITLKRNRSAFNNISLIPRVLRDTNEVTINVNFFENNLAIPIFIAPMAFHGAAHTDAEIATVLAANESGIGMITSVMSNESLEDISKISSCPLWFQLYIYKDRMLTESLVKRAIKSGYKALVITVDVPIMGKRERDERNDFKLPKHLVAKNFINTEDYEKYSSTGLEVANYTNALFDKSFTWKDLEWLKTITTLPIILKGIMHKDDVKLAIDMGVAGIIVSNHGGRQLDTMPATITMLPELVEVAEKKIPIMIDSGFRRGIDIFKALALGADCVLIGRPILWALAVDGQAGVTRLINLYKKELYDTMILCGCNSIHAIKKFGPSLIKI